MVQLGIDRTAVTPATVDQVMAVDARAAALMIAEFSRRLLNRGGSWGRMVGLASGGPNGFPTEVTYGAAKAAQVNYTMSAATELAPHGVTANVVFPGVTDTGWVNDDVRAFVAASSDHTHVATPEQVANVIGWLCTDEAALVTGNVIGLR
jgi:3-oxoacyl-[acyl-carrier protein] reductase